MGLIKFVLGICNLRSALLFNFHSYDDRISFFKLIMHRWHFRHKWVDKGGRISESNFISVLTAKKLLKNLSRSRSTWPPFRNKVHIFWEGHKNFAKSPPFLIATSTSQKKVEISQTFCGLLRMYELFNARRWFLWSNFFFVFFIFKTKGKYFYTFNHS